MYFKLRFVYLRHVIKLVCNVFVLPHGKAMIKQIVATSNTKLWFIYAYMKLKSRRRTGSV